MVSARNKGPGYEHPRKFRARERDSQLHCPFALQVAEKTPYDSFIIKSLPYGESNLWHAFLSSKSQLSI